MVFQNYYIINKTKNCLAHGHEHVCVCLCVCLSLCERVCACVRECVFSRFRSVMYSCPCVSVCMCLLHCVCYIVIHHFKINSTENVEKTFRKAGK